MGYNVAEPHGSAPIEESYAELTVRIKKRPLRAAMKQLVKIMATWHEMSFQVLCLSHALRKVMISGGNIFANFFSPGVIQCG